MPHWHGFHSDARISYYLHLRQERGFSARDAYAQLKQMDAHVLIALHGPQRETWISRLARLWDFRLRSSQPALAEDSTVELDHGIAKQH